MKRSELKRKTPLKPGNSLSRGTSRMRSSKPKSEKPKRAAAAGDEKYLAMCRGQPCYLLLPGVRCAPMDTVVPCHSNQSRHGKAMGMKANHQFTVPGCAACHRELDSGMRFTREEKFAFWDDAYQRWAHDRKIQFGSDEESFLLRTTSAVK